MRIAIFGAGAIGCYLAASLCRSEAHVTLIARGAQHKAIAARGITLIANGKPTHARPRLAASAQEAGIQDHVIVALKAQSFPDAASDIATMMGDETSIVTAMNGIPYWYFHGIESPFRNRAVQSVDPGGAVMRTLTPEHAIGCVIYCFAEVVEPGVVDQSGSDKIILGEPDGSIGARTKALAQALEQGGLTAPVTSRIRDELWGKLWGNLSMNPLSALTGATIDRLSSDPDLKGVARAMMVEAAAVAESLGVTFPMGVDERIRIAGRAGARKTSMLQDLERGRPLEIEAILGAVVELGALTDQALPICRTVLHLARERGRNAAQTGRD